MNDSPPVADNATDEDIACAHEMMVLRHRRANIQEAIALGERYLQEHPEAVRVMWSLGASYTAAKRYPQAESLYKKIIIQFPNNVRGYTGFALAALARGNLPEAENRSTEALQKFPHEYLAQDAFAKIMLLKENYETAETYFRLAAKIAPNNSSIQEGLARALIKQNKNDEAEAIILEQCQRHPHNIVFPLFLAVIATQKKDIKLLSLAYDKLTHVKPSAESLRLMAEMSRMGAGGGPASYNAILTASIQMGLISQPTAQPLFLPEGPQIGEPDMVMRTQGPTFIERAYHYANSGSIYSGLHSRGANMAAIDDVKHPYGR